MEMNLSQRTMGLERAAGSSGEIKSESDADTYNEVESDHRSGREENAEVNAHQGHEYQMGKCRQQWI